MESKIKASELMLNNYVYRKSDMLLTQINSVLVSHVRLWCNPLAMFNMEEIEPVMLDEQILLKCGYEKGNVCTNFTAFKAEPFVYLSADGSVEMSTGKKMYFLHELQNRVYSLTGKELEFKP